MHVGPLEQRPWSQVSSGGMTLFESGSVASGSSPATFRHCPAGEVARPTRADWQVEEILSLILRRMFQFQDGRDEHHSIRQFGGVENPRKLI